MKSIFKSKTLYLNAFAVIVAMVPGLNGFVAASPDTALAILGIGNFLLRLITKDKLTLV